MVRNFICLLFNILSPLDNGYTFNIVMIQHFTYKNLWFNWIINWNKVSPADVGNGLLLHILVNC